MRGDQRVAVEAGDVVVYPDSGKLLVASVADERGERRDMVGRLQEADYFDGEL